MNMKRIKDKIVDPVVSCLGEKVASDYQEMHLRLR